MPCASLLDHLVRLEEEGRGDREPERLGGLEIDAQLEFHGLLHRQVRRLGAFEDLVHKDRGAFGEAWQLLTSAISRPSCVHGSPTRRLSGAL